MIAERWQLVLLGLALAAAIQLVLYLVQLRTRDATAVDAGWAVSIVAVSALYAALAPGDLGLRILVACLAGLENLRVAALVLQRVGSGEEDARYRELRERWRERGREQATFLVFYGAQALVATALSLPLLLASFDGDGPGPLAWAGTALWAVAFALEWTADRQLAAFKRDPANRGATMRSGLWRTSRHPNYFFQTLTWVAYAVVALQAPWGAVGFVAPALILVLVLFVTGIPPAERQSLRSRGEDYRRYQAETSAFVPWPPRT